MADLAARTLAVGAAGAVAAAALGALTYGLVHAHTYRLRRRSVLVPNGAPSAEVRPLRILHISDAHTLASHTKRLGFLRGLADTKPDLVVLTGDMIAEDPALEPVLDALDSLLDVPGVFVFGSNDYVAPEFKNPLLYLFGPSNRGERRVKLRDDVGARFSGESFTQADAPDGARRTDVGDSTAGVSRTCGRKLAWRDMRDAFEARGWLNLNNRRGRVEVAGWTLDFVGVDDPHMDYDSYPATDNADEAGIERGSYARIGVTHAPYTRVLNRMVEDGCSLIFAGHTHGGQVCLPGGRALVTNCDLDPKLAHGLFEWSASRDSSAIDSLVRGDGAVVASGEDGTAWVQVSAGIGTSPFAPVRTFCHPEAIVMDIIPVTGS